MATEHSRDDIEEHGIAGRTFRIRMPEDPGAAGTSGPASKVKLLAGYDVKTVRPTGEKAVRAKPASARAEAGNLKPVRGIWNETFVEEVCSFPNAQHDDQVDTFADALTELALRSTFALANV